MDVLILAAGLGTRLGSLNIPKGLIKINNKSIVHNNIENIMTCIKIKNIIIVTSHLYKDIYHTEIRDLNINYKIIINDNIERGNGYSLFLAKKDISTCNFIMMMSDHLFSLSFIKKAIVGKGLAVDSDPAYIDINDATKVFVDLHGSIQKIGKEINNYNFIDTGFFILNKSIFKHTDYVEKINKKFGISDIVREANIQAIDITNNLWIDIDTKEDLFIAHKLFSNPF